MSRVIQTEKPTYIGCMYLEVNGVIGYQQAVVPLLFLMMEKVMFDVIKKSMVRFNLEMLFLGIKMNGMKLKLTQD